MVRNLGNQHLNIKTADLPPSSRRLSSIRWHHLPLHHRCNISVQTTRPMLGIFRNLRATCRPQDRLFSFLFYFSPDTATELRASSRPLLSAEPGTRSPPPEVAAAGLQRAWATPQISPQQSLTRFPLRLLSLHPRLSQLQRKYAAGPLASSFRC